MWNGTEAPAGAGVVAAMVMLVLWALATGPRVAPGVAELGAIPPRRQLHFLQAGVAFGRKKRANVSTQLKISIDAQGGRSSLTVCGRGGVVAPGRQGERPWPAA